MAKSIKNYNLPDSITAIPADVEVRPAVVYDTRQSVVTVSYDCDERADEIIDAVQYARDLIVNARRIRTVKITERRQILMRPGIVR